MEMLRLTPASAGTERSVVIDWSELVMLFYKHFNKEKL